MNKTYFLILNYKTKKETENCVKSIRRLESANCEIGIMIIDNASNDGSFEYLNNLYKDETDIEIYRTEKNIGFSKANNFGYSLIKNKGNVSFVIVCNSDIEFCQTDFLSRVFNEYSNSRFYVVGPCVYCDSDKKKIYHGYQSPLYPYEWKKWYVESRKSYWGLNLKKLKNDRLTLKEQILFKSAILIEKFTKVLVGTVYFRYRKNRHEDIPLHGSCIILSERFIKEENILFYPETRFYGEELLLFLRTKRKGYKTIYDPNMLVYHMQGRATEQVGSNKKAELFRAINLKSASDVYLEELKNEQNMKK